MIGVPLKYENIPPSGILEVNKKKKMWYEHYTFPTEEDQLVWYEWMAEQVRKTGLYEDQEQEEIDYMNMVYGLNYAYKKNTNEKTVQSTIEFGTQSPSPIL